MIRSLLWIALAAVACSAEDLPEVLQRPDFQHFYNLEFDEALAEFQARVTADPNSAEAHNLVAQALIFRAMYDAGALESNLVSDKNPFLKRPKVPMKPEDEKLFLDSIDTAIRLGEARLKDNPNDTDALYALGVAYGLRANYEFLVRKAWISTLRSFNRARRLHNRVTQLDPANVDAQLTQGGYTYVVGNLVFPWKQLGFLAGFRGDKQEGIRILQKVAEQGRLNKVDAMVFLAAIYRRDHRPADAVPLVEQLVHWFPRNYLFPVELTYLYNDLHDSTKALAEVDKIEEMRRRRAPGFLKLSDARMKELRESIGR